MRASWRALSAHPVTRWRRHSRSRTSATGGSSADCVNPVAASREGWRAVAVRAAVRLIEVEVVCSDEREHRRRVEGRVSDIPGLVPPSWEAIQRLDYEPWDRPRLVVDSAALSPSEALAAVLGIMAQGGLA